MLTIIATIFTGILVWLATSVESSFGKDIPVWTYYESAALLENAETFMIGETMGGLCEASDNHLMDSGNGGGAGASGEY